MKLPDGFKPLYKQVYDLLEQRIIAGDWKPSEPLPSEHALAAELEVSQGTVRKALNQLVTDNLLVRRQGKGTYVAELTQENSMLRFFRFRRPQGECLQPETHVLSVKRRQVSSKELQHLALVADENVVEMVRVRSLEGAPAIVEIITQPLRYFPNIDLEEDWPNFLYSLYQEKFGLSIVEVREELKAVALDKKFAALLNLDAGAPVLLVERESVNIDGRVVEWSQAYCATEDFVYAASMR